MATANNVNPNSPTIAPGVTTTPNVYPQWGVKQTGSGGSNDYSVKEATTAAEKTTLLDQGYDVWFSSESAANGFVSSENSILNGNVSSPLNYAFKLTGLSGTNLVNRALKIIIGGILVLFGVIHLTGVSGSVASTVKKVPLPL